MNDQLVSPRAPSHGRPHLAAREKRTRRGTQKLLCGWAVTSAVGLAAWILCETLGGLLFLACGVRLWRYTLTPILWEIASPVGWLEVFAVAGVNCFGYLLVEHRLGVRGGRRWLYRALFLMIAGPINEVVFNTLTWLVAGTPVYLYTLWPTFGGSGSVLSPLYYLTLLLGFWLEEWIPRSLASRGRRCRRPSEPA